MGYGFYMIGDRPCGYLVLATCDRKGCEAAIDRGMGYLCGDEPGRVGIDGGPGCHRYLCPAHIGWVYGNGNCPHRGKRAWGRTLSCMAPNEDGSIVCLDRTGHRTKHAWAT